MAQIELIVCKKLLMNTSLLFRNTTLDSIFTKHSLVAVVIISIIIAQLTKYTIDIIPYTLEVHAQMNTYYLQNIYPVNEIVLLLKQI